jgi:hypothetical protein
MELRTVEVINPRVPMFGSGALVAPGLVLTAYHVACPGGDRQPVTVRDKIGHAAEATIAWADAELDAGLLQTDRNVLGAGLPVARWGELTCDYPDARPVCSMTASPGPCAGRTPRSRTRSWASSWRSTGTSGRPPDPGAATTASS